MSMVIAVVAKDCIVLAADTICMFGDDTAHYSDKHSKLYVASNPKFVIGLTGSKGADKFLHQHSEWSSLDFDQTVERYREFAFDEYKKGKYSFNFYYLICGYDKFGEPQIERVRFERESYSGMPISDVEPVNPRHAIGIEKHGAWYLLANYYRPKMSRDDAMLFVYLCLREVIRHDERTRGPIEIMVVSPSSPAYSVPETELKQLTKETDKRLSSITSIFTESFVLQ